MKLRDLLIIVAAFFAAGYFLNEPLPPHKAEAGYDQPDIMAVNQLAVTPVNLLQRQAAGIKDMYGLTDELDGEPRENIFGEKRK